MRNDFKCPHFARPLLNEAQEMATEYLENGDED